jgi:hypothetical protein
MGEKSLNYIIGPIEYFRQYMMLFICLHIQNLNCKHRIIQFKIKINYFLLTITIFVYRYGLHYQILLKLKSRNLI